MFVVSLWVSLHVCFSLCLFICWRGSLLVRCLHLVVLLLIFFFSSRRRHTRCLSDWNSDVCSSDLDFLSGLLNNRTKIVAFNHVSNAIGTINPISELVRLVRQKTDAILVCDGAQSAPHFPVSFDSLGVDFYAFSGHKMLGPMGIGGLVGKRDMLEEMPPYQTGGDMIEFVHDDRTTWNVLPHKFEAGTPNAANAVGLAAAVEYLDRIGMDRVITHERSLMSIAQERLALIDGLGIYGPAPGERRGGVRFRVNDVHPDDLAR